MLEYDVVKEGSLDTLIVQVQKRLDNGWQLVGGICADPHCWAQAVCRQSVEPATGDGPVDAAALGT